MNTLVANTSTTLTILRMNRFFGRFLGKAIMEQQSIKATLSLPLRKQIIEMPITFSDLEFVDDELFRNLKWLKDNDQVHHLMLDFSITYTYATPASENNQKAEGEGKTHAEAVNKTVTFDLVPNGSEVLVSDDNKHEYLRLRLQHRMLDSIKAQLEQLLTGEQQFESQSLRISQLIARQGSTR